MAHDSEATRQRILAAAEELVLEYGFGSTTVDAVISASGTSKGAFFHHFASKSELANELVARIVAVDLQMLDSALKAIADVTDPRERLLEFLAYFEQAATLFTEEETGCLYISVLTERQLIDAGTADQIVTVIRTWRAAIADLARAALGNGRPDIDPERLADHFFVTFEGAFLLSRALGEPQLAGQLLIMRRMVEALLSG